MQTVNDLIAAYHRNQTEAASLFATMERAVIEKDQQLTEANKKIAELEAVPASTAVPE